jgi:hypothetical protein
MSGRVMRSLLLATAAVAVACGSPAPSVNPSASTSCREAFQAWVDNASSLNRPGTDVTAALVAGEGLERRVFEACSLAEAEQLNLEILVEYQPGSKEPLIKPDMRSFAEIECVDESPLLDGTRLCGEVGH